MKQSPTFIARRFRASSGSRCIWLLICLSLFLLALPALSITLVDNDTTDYVIAKQTGCDSTTSTAASDLQNYINQISGVTIPIYSYANLGVVPAKAIVIGNLVTSPSLALEQVEMKVSSDQLILRGGSSTAHRYAVFAFLEEELGCRYYSPTVEYVPSLSTITVANDYDGTHTPSFEYRYVYQQDVTSNATWCVKNRVNGQLTIDGTHNMYNVVPPGTYFGAHPEYYPLHGGERDYNSSTQWLCFTNEDLPQIIADYVESRMAATNANTIINVGQGDASDSCECASCQALYASEGNAWSAVMLNCLNAAADIVAQTYPTRKMMTFAYMHTEHPPSTIAPVSNLIVRLCHWRKCDLHGLTVCSSQDHFQSHLAAWNALTDPEQLYIWHYTTNYKSQAAVWPNVNGLIPDIQEYYNNGVRGIYEQGVYWGKGGDLGWLKPYLMAKALWDKDVSASTVYNDFLTGYYGDAADEMDDYIQLLETQAANWHPNGITVTVDQILANVLPAATFAEAEDLYDAAEAAASAVSQELYDRVHYDRYSLLYMHIFNKKQLEQISSPADRLVQLGDNNYYLWKEAFFSIVGSTRGCGGEYSCDARARADLRPQQAGDLLIMENDNIKLAVCPWLQGAIVSLIDKRTGIDLLHPARKSDDSTSYPFNGYYTEAHYASTGYLYPRSQMPVSADIDTDGNGNQIMTVVTDFGIMSWTPDEPTHRATRVITLPPGDASSFNMSLTITNLTGSTTYSNQTTKATLGLETLNNYTNIVVTEPDDSTTSITAFPTTLDAKQVDFDNGKYGVRLSVAFDQSLPTTSLTIDDSPTGMPQTLSGTYNTGTHTFTPAEEEEVLNETWTLSEIPAVPVPEYITWQDFRSTTADYSSGSRLTKNSGAANGWNADAISTKRIVGDGYVEFKASALAQQLVMGLSLTNSSAADTDIDYGIATFYTSPTTYCQAKENGTFVGTAQVMTSANDVLRVERVGTTVYYKLNGNTFHTSAVSSSGEPQVDCSIYKQPYGFTACRICAESFYEPPVVTILDPVDDAVFAPGSDITLEADAYCTDGGSITKVEFFRGAKYIGEDSTFPYTVDWTDVRSGSYSLTAKAYSGHNITTVSTAVDVRVNALPAVSVTSPSDGTTYGTAPSSITITADASDSDGTISTVHFYVDGDYVGEDTASPYSFDWDSPAVGAHALTTKAIDSDEGETFSYPATQVNVEVTPPTTSITSPSNNAVIVGNSVTINANAADSDGSIANVEFYQGQTKLGEDSTSPYSYAWTNVGGGDYTLRVKAIDDDGAVTNSSAVAVTVWNTSDIGSVGLTGSASYSSGTFTVTGAGLGITGTADSFRYVYKPVTGDFTFIARLATFPSAVLNNRAAIVARETLDVGAKTAATVDNPYSNRVYFNWRTTTDGTAQLSAYLPNANEPQYMKLVRTADVFKSYRSNDATTWYQAGSNQTVIMSDTVYIGMMVTSAVTNTLKTCTYDTLSITSP